MISRMDGYLSVGSTGGRDYDERDMFGGEEFDRVPTENAKIELLQRAIDVMPALVGAELIEQLAGSRPLSPDTKPIIGPVPGWSGVFLATGHTTKGIHLGPITGRMIRDWLIDGECKLFSDMSQFLPDRFSDIGHQDYGAASTMVDE
jgi:glycine oxidase